MRNYLELLGLSDAELANFDPLVMNLLVAKSIPSLAELDIEHYQRMADEMAEDVRKQLPHADQKFQRNPSYWNNDVNFIRLAALFRYLGRTAGVQYKKEHAEIQNKKEQVDRPSILYTDPSDLFLNGVMDTREGTCANMPALFMAIAWRLGWPVSMACARAHNLCRYDDGKVAYNVEASQIGLDGLSAPEDAHYINYYKLSARALSSGSDLRALKPREMLGVFVGFRARNMQDSGNPIEAEKDYLLARYLFPTNHQLYFKGTGATLLRAAEMFASNEEGNPLYWEDFIAQVFGSKTRMIWRPSLITTVAGAGYTIKL